MKIEIISCTSRYNYSNNKYDIIYYAVVTYAENNCPFLVGENIYREIHNLSVAPKKYAIEAVVHPDSYNSWKRI